MGNRSLVCVIVVVEPVITHQSVTLPVTYKDTNCNVPTVLQTPNDLCIRMAEQTRDVSNAQSTVRT